MWPEAKSFLILMEIHEISWNYWGTFQIKQWNESHCIQFIRFLQQKSEKRNIQYFYTVKTLKFITLASSVRKAVVTKFVQIYVFFVHFEWGACNGIHWSSVLFGLNVDRSRSSLPKCGGRVRTPNDCPSFTVNDNVYNDNDEPSMSNSNLKLLINQSINQ